MHTGKDKTYETAIKKHCFESRWLIPYWRKNSNHYNTNCVKSNDFLIRSYIHALANKHCILRKVQKILQYDTLATGQ